MNQYIAIIVAIILAVFSSQAEAAGAWGAGDTVALLFGLLVGIIGFFAIMGCVARRSGSA